MKTAEKAIPSPSPARLQVPFRSENDGACGNGIVSREPILSHGRISLPQGNGAEERSVAVVETASCVFASAHLDNVGKDARLEQVSIINGWFNEKYSGYGKPVLLCGDMNDTPESETLAHLLEFWTPLSGTDFTSSTENPHACIDFVFALKSATPVEVLDSQVLSDGTASLSDHFPVRLSIRFFPGKN